MFSLKKNMELKVNRLHRLIGHNGAIYCLAKGENDTFYSVGGDGWAVEWHVQDPEVGKVVAKVEKQNPNDPLAIFQVHSIPHEDLIVLGLQNGNIHWIDLKDSSQSKHLAGHKSSVFEIIHFQDYLFTLGYDGFLYRWSIAERKKIDGLQLSKKTLRAACIIEHDNMIAIGSSDNNIYFVNLFDLSLERKIENAHSNSVFSIWYDKVNDTIISGGRDAMLKVWAYKTAILVQEVKAHNYTINKIIGWENKNLLATASRDKTIKIWEKSTLKLLKVLESNRDNGHMNSVNDMIINGIENDTLVSCSDDRTIILWNIEF
jgi:WD repeat-containing protein 61